MSKGEQRVILSKKDDEELLSIMLRGPHKGGGGGSIIRRENERKKLTSKNLISNSLMKNPYISFLESVKKAKFKCLVKSL